jgi:hypothetical protein
MAESAPPVAAPASKKKPNRLLVEEATNDDNSVVTLNTATMEELTDYGLHTPPSGASTRGITCSPVIPVAFCRPIRMLENPCSHTTSRHAHVSTPCRHPSSQPQPSWQHSPQ